MPESMKTEALLECRSDFANEKASSLLKGSKPCSESGTNSSITRNSPMIFKHGFIRDELAGSRIVGLRNTKAPPSHQLHPFVLAAGGGKAETISLCDQLERGEGSTGSDNGRGRRDLIDLENFLRRHLNASYLVEHTDAPLAKTLLSQMDSYLSVSVSSLLQLSEVAAFLDHLSPSNRLEKLLAAIHSSPQLTLRDDLSTQLTAETGADGLSLRVGPTSHAAPTSLCTLLFQCDPNDGEAVAVLRSLNRDQVKAALPGLSVLIVEPLQPRVQTPSDSVRLPPFAYATLANCADALRALALLQDKPLHAGLAVRLRFEKPLRPHRETSANAQTHTGVPQPPLPVSELDVPSMHCSLVNRCISLPFGIYSIDDDPQNEPPRPSGMNVRHLCPSLTPPSSVDAGLEDFVSPSGNLNWVQGYDQGRAGGLGGNASVTRGDPILGKDKMSDGGDLFRSVSCLNTASPGLTEGLPSAGFADPGAEGGGAPDASGAAGLTLESPRRCVRRGRCGGPAGLGPHRLHSGLDPRAAPWMGWGQAPQPAGGGGPVLPLANPPVTVQCRRCDPYIGGMVVSTSYPGRAPDGVAGVAKGVPPAGCARGNGCNSHFKDPLKMVALYRRIRNEGGGLNSFSENTSPSSLGNAWYILKESTTDNTDDNVSNMNSKDGS